MNIIITSQFMLKDKIKDNDNDLIFVFVGQIIEFLFHPRIFKLKTDKSPDSIYSSKTMKTKDIAHSSIQNSHLLISIFTIFDFFSFKVFFVLIRGSFCFLQCQLQKSLYLEMVSNMFLI